MMIKAPTLREIPDLPEEIKQAGLNGDLVLFVGAGMSMLVDLPSWSGLAYKALEYLQTRGWLDYSELEQLQALSPRTQLSIATLIAKENEDTLGLERYFNDVSKDSGVSQSIDWSSGHKSH